MPSTPTAAVIILFRGTKERHLEVLTQAVQAVIDSDLTPVCIAPENTVIPDALGAERAFYNQASPDSLTDAVQRAVADRPIRRILALDEKDVQPAAHLRGILGIPGLTSRQSVYFRDKNAMAARSAELGLNVAPSCQPHTLATVEEFATRVGYPLVVKPYDGVSCINTYKVNDAVELRQLWPSIEEQRHDYRVEGFVHGRQFHVDTIVRDGVVVFESVSEYTATILDNHGHGPLGSIAHADTDNPQHLALLRQNRTVLDGFGLTTGITHAEFFLQDDGKIVFGEIAARMAGAWNTMIYAGAYGMQLAYTWVRTEIDPDYHWKPDTRRPAAAEFLWTDSTGTIESITPAETLEALPGVFDVQIWKKPGDLIHPNEGTRGQDIGRIIITGSSVEAVKEYTNKARNTFRVTTR
ncbi:ATP-grasp domain-containing protein [Streptomyces durhamensis]|uniref:ATP-grasp domain-containing protein n=1 Tax=Streptomyces durhamensis TaxID=68194 RepID=UPI00068B54CF|nr:ATP-grasp domain-containing protein [Streptomyces durhamensis]URS64321.1 VlpG [Streptomyces durhamensis]